MRLSALFTLFIPPAPLQVKQFFNIVKKRHFPRNKGHFLTSVPNRFAGIKPSAKQNSTYNKKAPERLIPAGVFAFIFKHIDLRKGKFLWIFIGRI